MSPFESMMAMGTGAVPVALCRYYISLWGNCRFNTPVVGTLTVNLGGAFLMGFLSYSLPHLGLAPWFTQGVTVGFLGPLTTFSTFTLASVSRWQQQKTVWAWPIG